MSADIRAELERHGGLSSLSDLAARWGLTPSRLTVLSHDPSFPAPILTTGGRRALYLTNEADAWRAGRKGN